MTNEEISLLVNQYFRKEGYEFPTEFEHRFDSHSSAILYSLIRKFKPVSCLEIGTWLGGSTCLIMAALIKNGDKFRFIASEIEEPYRSQTAQNVETKTGRKPLMIGDITTNLRFVPEQLDFLMVDTNHDRETTDFIVKNIFPLVVKGGLVCFHDFAVKEVNGKWEGKAAGGVGALPETIYYMEMKEKGEWPFEKIYIAYQNPAWEEMGMGCESAFWEKR